MLGFVALYFVFECRTLKRKLKTRSYKLQILAILLYGGPAWGCAAKSTMTSPQVIQNKILRNIRGRDRYASDT
jgi:hypothetical protein